MTTNTNAAQVAKNLIAVAEDQAFEAWYKQDCLVGGVNARIAARAAWNARAALTTAAAVPPEGWVMVPVELAERVQESLGEFLMDHGWSQRDMDTSDDFGAVLLAAAPKEEPVPAGEYPPLPTGSAWCGDDDVRDFGTGPGESALMFAPTRTQQVPLFTADQMRAYVDADRAARAAQPLPAGEYLPLPRKAGLDDHSILPEPGFSADQMHAYVDADRAMRAQAAPAAVAVRESFDADGFKEWVKRNLPDDTIIGSSEWWANHLTLWAQRFFTVSAAPQPPAQVQEPFGYFRAEPFGWTDCAADEDGAKALYEHPAPQPAPVAQGDAQPMQPSDDDVICPSCSHQFRAIPVNVQKLMLDAGIAPPFTSSAQKDVAMDTFQKNGIAWAVDRWKSEVMNRPMRNLHRRSLDDAWRQVVRYFGGCPDTLLGPCHDASRAQAREGAIHE